MKPVKKPLHKDSPLEEWDAAARQLAKPTSGEELRAQTLLADEILEEIFREEKETTEESP